LNNHLWKFECDFFAYRNAPFHVTAIAALRSGPGKMKGENAEILHGK